jgi:hypothetical protein
VSDLARLLVEKASSVETTAGALDLGALDDERLALWRRLPGDLQQVLARWNGARFVAGSMTFANHVEIDSSVAGQGMAADSLDELWSVSAGTELVDIVAQNEAFAEEEFIPTGVLAVGLCITDSLLCVSLNDHDFGHVYYWDWYWEYPWKRAFFEARVQAARAEFADVDAILRDRSNPDYWAASDRLNYATLVDVAPSFTDWISGTWRELDEDD